MIMGNQQRCIFEDLGNGINLEMIHIPDGTFMMDSPAGIGGNSEQPQHQVDVKSFFMSKYPITQAQWKAIASLPKIQRDLDPNPARFKNCKDSDRRPVENISWDDAVEFCERLSKKTEGLSRIYRLTTEAEWEYACRAGTITPFHFGKTITDQLANYGMKVGETTPVRKYPPNNFGLYDMHGNVWEWCKDDWHDDYQYAPTDRSAWYSKDNLKKVIRGGSWKNQSNHCSLAFRDSWWREEFGDNIGFRVVCIAPSYS